MSKKITTKPFYNSEIPSDWEVKKLGECCLIKGEYGINAAAVEYSDELPTYIRITDIDDDGNYSAVKKVSVEDENSGSFILTKGDIVFARTGATVGKTYLYDERDGELVFAGFLIRFRPNEKILLSQHLKNLTASKFYWDWVKTVSMRSGQPGINAEEYGSLKLPLPPLPEQKAIAHILSLMDTAINKNNLLIAKKELQKKWLMQNLLTGKKRLKGFEKEKWKEVKLGNIGKIKMCKRIFNDETKNEGDIPFYKIGTFGKIADAFIPKELYNEYKSRFSFPKKGEILISAAGTLGRTVIYDGSPAYFQDSNIVWISHDESKALNEYLFYVYKIIRYDSEGGTIQRLYNSIISNAKINLPSLKEQTAIAKVLQASDREIQLLKTKTEKLRKKKIGLMQQLLTGKKRLTIKK